MISGIGYQLKIESTQAIFIDSENIMQLRENSEYSYSYASPTRRCVTAFLKRGKQAVIKLLIFILAVEQLAEKRETYVPVEWLISCHSVPIVIRMSKNLFSTQE